MTPSKIQKKVEQSAKPDRRGGRRVPHIQPCLYQFAQVDGYEIIEFSDGHAMSLNTSPGGFLFLMPQPLEKNQVFEVHMPFSTEEERMITLVEACWTRELKFGTVGRVYLVGVRSLFEPARFN